jgi:hypothetical protein
VQYQHLVMVCTVVVIDMTGVRNPTDGCHWIKKCYFISIILFY